MNRRTHAFLVASLLLWGCRAPATDELPRLAERPPLAASALLTGGAFVEPGRSLSGAPPRRTFPEDGEEAIALDALREALLAARVFTRVDVDPRPSPARRELAAATWPPSVEARALHAWLQDARAAGHDLLLVVERLEDGPVESQGINGQWPITLATWLLVGLGVVIPDHSYESRASLRASLRDVHDGHLVQELVVEAGPVDLSLVQRTDVWGFLASVIVPPFWVGDDDRRVEGQLRRVGQTRLVWAVAQRLKTVDVADRLARAAPVQALLRRVDGRRHLELLAKEPLSFVRVRVDGRPWLDPDFDRFHAQLLAQPASDAGSVRYVAILPATVRGARLQVISQTVTGRVGSTTLLLEENQ